MPKSMYISPKDFLSGDDVKFNDMPSFKYSKTLKDELNDSSLTKDDVIEILYHMKIIRQYETFLQELKQTGSYKDISFRFPGPAHIALGQEAVAVGQYFTTDKDDMTYGAHRNHAEVIAKGLSAIYKMSDDELNEIMDTYFDGEIKEVIENKKDYIDVKEKAIHFFLYGVNAEIFAKKQGINRGLGGSMHMFFPPFGIFPNNAIVGAGLPLALGSALYKLEMQKPGIVVANIGDGGVSTGPVWESLHFAVMDQFKELWDKPYNKRPPLMVNVINNGYGMGGQTVGETMGYKEVARLGSSFNPEGLHAERVNGMNVLALIDMMKRKRKIVEDGDGPVLNEMVAYRFSGHSSADAEPYRDEEEVKQWREEMDPVVNFTNEVIQEGLLTQEQVDLITNDIDTMVDQIFAWTRDEELSTPLDFENNDLVLDDMMINDSKFEINTDKDVEMNNSYEENSRIKKLVKKQRYGIDTEKNKEFSPIKRLQIRDSIFEAVLDQMHKEPSLIVYGEEHRDWGGAYAVYRDLTESAPYHRFFNAPIAEAAIVGSAVGYALAGGQAIVEVMYFDFLWRAGDEIANQMAKWPAMSGGTVKVPVVVRTVVGYGYGAQHSQDMTAVIAHIPGLKMVNPVTPYDAKGLMTAALNQSTPTIFVEIQELYDKGELFVESGVPTDSYEVEIGKSVVRQEGTDLTIATLGAQLYTAREAVKEFAKYGVSVELIDLRTSVPLDYSTLIDSVKKTGNVLLGNNGNERNNFMKEVASNVTNIAFDFLDSAPQVLGARNWIMPSEDYTEYIYPTVDDYLSAYHLNVKQLNGYTPLKNHTNIEKLRRLKKGV